MLTLFFYMSICTYHVWAYGGLILKGLWVICMSIEFVVIYYKWFWRK